MNVIICIDDNNGMMFNKRRQSSDVKVLENIAGLTNKLWISPFSEKLFANTNLQTKMTIQTSDELLAQAEKDEFCFVENQKLLAHADRIEQLIVYKWNRNYPSDFKLDLNLDEWSLVETTDFEGKSHEKITREIYVKS